MCIFLDGCTQSLSPSCALSNSTFSGCDLDCVGTLRSASVMPHRNCIHGKDLLQISIVSEKLQRKMVLITTLTRVTAWLRIPSLWAAIQMGPAFMGSWIWRAMCLNGSPMGIRGIIKDFHRLRTPLNLKMAPTKPCGGGAGTTWDYGMR